MCKSGEFVKVNETETSNRQCQTWKTCLADEYESAAGSLYTDAVCTKLTVCDTTLEYEANAPSYVTDRNCTRLTECVVGTEYESVEPEYDADRVCTTYTPCTATEYLRVAGTATADNDCQNLTVCLETEVELRAPTTTSNRICYSTQEATPMASFNAARLGFKQKETVRDTGVSRQEYNLFANLVHGSSGTVTASLGDKSVSASFTRSKATASRIQQVLMASAATLYPDDGVVKVAFQTTGADGSTVTSGGQINVELRGSQQSTSLSGSGNIGGTHGRCVVSVSVPSSWFDDAGTISVFYGLAGEALQEATFGVTMVEALSPAITDLTQGDVSLEVPRRTVYEQQSFDVAVRGHGSERAVLTFNVQCTTQGGLLRFRTASFDESIWSVSQTTSGDGGQITVSGKALDRSKRPTGSQVGKPAEDLFNIGVDVIGAGTPDVECKVIEFLNLNNGNPMNFNDELATVYDRDGTRRGKATVYVGDRSAIIGYLYGISQATLVNTAVLDGQRVSPTAGIVVYYADGRNADATALVTCSGDERVQSDAGCAIYLSGTETRGGTGEVVITEASSGNRIGALSVKVYFPRLPVPLFALDSSELRRIEGANARDESGVCGGARYQQTSVYSEAEFAAGTSDFKELDVTHLIKDRLQADGSDVVELVDGTTVRGLKAGDAIVSVSGAKSASFSTLSMKVSDSTTTVFALEVSVVKSLVMSGVPGNVAADDSSFSASVSVMRKLTKEFETASVYTEAVFTNGLRYVIGEDEGLFLTSRNVDVMELMSNTSARAVGSATGPMIEARWRDVCSGSLIGLGLGYVENTLPSPDDVVIEVQDNGRMAPAGSVAALLGNSVVRSRLSVRVFFTFKTGPRQEMTADRRIRYGVTENAGLELFDIEQSGSAVELYSDESKHSVGSGKLFVSFTHVNLTKTYTVNVVEASRCELTVRPFPAYSGSSGVDVNELRVIAETGQRQKAVVSMFVGLSDGSRYETTANGASRFVSSEPTVADFSGTVLSAKSAGGVQLSGSFSTLQTGVPLTIAVLEEKVTVVSYVSVTFPQTLSGVTGVKREQLQFGVKFSDGRIYERQDLFESKFSAPALPNLVTFSMSDVSPAAAPAFVDTSTGTVTLDRNYPEQVSVNAVAVGPGGTAGADLGGRAFFCNLEADAGDVDLGRSSSAAVGRVASGSSVSVDVRVNTAGKTAATISLEVHFDDSLFSVSTVTRGSAIRSGTFNFNPDAARGKVSFSSTGTSVSGSDAHVATIEFRVAAGVSGTKVFELGGEVVTIADIDGNMIPADRSGRVEFVAGLQDVIVEGTRRRRSAASERLTLRHYHESVKPSAMRHSLRELSRRRRNVGSKCNANGGSCEECSQGRETGDADGNCVFDGRDATFIQVYVNRKTANPNDPFVTGILASQAQYLDVDQNGDVLVQDSEVLARINEKLLYFVTDVSISQPAAPGCTLDVTARLIQGGKREGDSVPAADKVSLYVNFASESVLGDDFDQGSVLNGSAVSVTSNIGGRLRVVQASRLSEAGVYGVKLGSGLSPSYDVGVTLLLSSVTSATSSDTSESRIALLTGSLNTPTFTFRQLEMQLDIDTQSVSISTGAKGYNARQVFRPTQTSLACFAAQECDYDEQYTSVAASYVSAPVCATLTVCEDGAEYESRAKTTVADRVCDPYTPCTATEYLKTPGSATTDNDCDTLTVCKNFEYIDVPATASSDRKCAIRRACNTTTTYYEYYGNATHDSKCIPLTPCDKASSFEYVAPTATSDRECELYILQSKGTDAAESNNNALAGATASPLYVLLASAVILFLAVCICVYDGRLGSISGQVAVNICFASGVALLLFAIGAHQESFAGTFSAGDCAGLGMVLHATILSVFTWLLAQAIVLCTLASGRTSADRTAAGNFFALYIGCYGLPAVVAIALYAANIGMYGSLGVCFVAPGTPTVVGLALPLALMALAALITGIYARQLARRSGGMNLHGGSSGEELEVSLSTGAFRHTIVLVLAVMTWALAVGYAETLQGGTARDALVAALAAFALFFALSASYVYVIADRLLLRREGSSEEPFVNVPLDKVGGHFGMGGLSVVGEGDAAAQRRAKGGSDAVQVLSMHRLSSFLSLTSLSSHGSAEPGSPTLPVTQERPEGGAWGDGMRTFGLEPPKYNEQQQRPESGSWGAKTLSALGIDEPDALAETSLDSLAQKRSTVQEGVGDKLEWGAATEAALPLAGEKDLDDYADPQDALTGSEYTDPQSVSNEGSDLYGDIRFDGSRRPGSVIDSTQL